VLASSIAIPLPLTRLPPWYPGQSGVPGTGTETGLRVHTTGAVFYVDPNYPGVSDLRHGTEPLYPLATVGAALTKCQPYRGDTILVMANNAWTYTNPALGWTTPIAEAVTVNVPGIRIVGVSPSGAVGVPWSVPTAQWGFTVAATDVLIEGFAFMGVGAGSNGIRATWGPPAAFGDNLVVRHCLFDDAILTAISLDFVWNAEVMGCAFEGCDYGIWCDTPGSSIESVRVIQNWFQGCTLGAITLPEAEDCLIVDNWVHAAVPATDTFIDLSAGGGNIVANNWLGCPLGVGAGQYGDVNSAGPGDQWIANKCADGTAITNP